MPDNNTIDDKEEKTFIQMIQTKLGVISSIVGSLVIIGSAATFIQSSEYGVATKGWVSRAMEEDNIQRDRQAIEDRVVLLEGEIRNWTIQFVDLNESRRRIAIEINDLNTLIQKSNDLGNNETDEHQILLNLRNRAQQELDEIIETLEND